MHLKPAVWIVFTSLWAGAEAQAQDPALDRPVPDHTAAESGESDEAEDPMAWLGIGVKVGIASNGEGEIDNPTFIDALPAGPGNKRKLTIDSRTGWHLAVPVNLGGDGIGLLLEPSLTFASIEGASTTTGKKKDYGVTVISGYLGPNLNLHPIDPLYIGVGAGLKVGYATSDIYDFGLDIFGRVPITATFYVIEDLALVAEFAFGYGVTGYAAKEYVSTATAKVEKPDLEFAPVSSWDLTIGVRFP